MGDRTGTTPVVVHVPRYTYELSAGLTEYGRRIQAEGRDPSADHLQMLGRWLHDAIREHHEEPPDEP